MTAQDLTRLWSASLCKTHKWLLIVQSPQPEVKWCGHDVQFGYGTQVPEEELSTLVELACSDQCRWAIYALTEPELSDQEASQTLDFMFPLHAAMLGEKLTVKDTLQAILDYADQQLVNIGRRARCRGLLDMAPSEHRQPPVILDAYTCGKLLCSPEVQIQPQYAKSIATKTAAMAHIWYARCTQEMLPMFYMQKLYGCGDRYWSYYIGAPDSLADAEAAMQLELHALEACLEAMPSSPRALTRLLGSNRAEYVDIMLEETPLVGDSYPSLDSLHRKLLVLVRRSEPAVNYGIDLATHAEGTKKKLMLAHRNDALSSIVRHAWPEIDTWQS